MSIQKLRGNQYEPQRAYMWDIRIKGPLVLPSAENLTFLAQSITIPPKSVDTITVPFQGERRNYAGMDSTEQTFTVDFLETEKAEVASHFRRWMFLVRNHVMRGAVDRTLCVCMFDARLKDVKDDKVTTLYRFEDAYPISIGEITLDYSSNEAISIPVTFAYRLRQEQFDL